MLTMSAYWNVARLGHINFFKNKHDRVKFPHYQQQTSEQIVSDENKGQIMRRQLKLTP